MTTSRSLESRSRTAGLLASRHLGKREIDVDYFDARNLSYELDDDELQTLRGRFAAADGLLLCFPIHDWGACPFTRQILIKAFSEELHPFRPTGLIAGGGGPRSFLAYADLALMLTAESNATIVGAAVHAAGELVDPATGDIDPGLAGRIEALAEALARLARR
ncbi:NADPH-dependent FMN reductase [Streptomyces sp. NPDC059466]|uniref:NADPH-dependent FMN reductase n=1 Tax=unclassified Streptomyces TaxID=2593676 RepID=UPI0036B44801